MRSLEKLGRRLAAITLGSLGGAGVVVFLTMCTPLPAGEPASGPSGTSRSGTGQLRGSVTLGPRLMARRMRFTLYPDVSGAASPGASIAAPEIRNVVLYLSSPSLETPRPSSPPEPFRMEQRNESFSPHVLAVVKGSTVEFPNGDPIYHNVFSLSKASTFDLGRYPRGSSRSVRFDEPGVVKVFCHIHSDMSGVILVLDNPYFTSPDEAGNFLFPDLPSGAYTVTAWHERARPIHRDIQIRAGQATNLDFAIPLEDAPLGD